jgi:hypothetical protein
MAAADRADAAKQDQTQNKPEHRGSFFARAASVEQNGL